MKKITKTVHAPNTQKGHGDSYGSGIINKMGKVRSDSLGMKSPISKKLKKPPRSLA
jgi:hypothetical protein